MRMPFSSITDEGRLNAAKNAYERAWAAIKERQLQFLTDEAVERERLAYIVAGLAVTHPDDDLAKLALDKFLATAVVGPSGGTADPE
jgi:hypothetical protein